MKYDPLRHNRQSIRLSEYDYTRPGAYFVTMVCSDRLPLFDDPRLKGIVEECWRWLEEHHDNVSRDSFVVMPNHLHGIVVIRQCRGGSRTAPTKPLGRLVDAFKTTSTRRINLMRGTQGLPVWPRDYYEHIIRNEQDFARVRKYIAENPRQWETDDENPASRPAMTDQLPPFA